MSVTISTVFSDSTTTCSLQVFAWFVSKLEPKIGIEPMTSFVPRKRSTTELRGHLILVL